MLAKVNKSGCDCVQVCMHVCGCACDMEEMEEKGYTKFRKREKTPDTVIWSPSLRANNKT